ncbi:GNAT family N-acetyltransferase [Allokutzneria oryzae]|uniref:GNAT family N-acetyltransferase n=1 Tax=Allokutzneria oryzae TaxID=1378989 RepID=A0ABV6ABP3_9PSEU
MTTVTPRIRSLTETDFDAFHDATSSAFLFPATDAARQRERDLFDLRRFHGAFDGDEMIGGAGILSKNMTLPGTGMRPVAAVTAVGTTPDNRRRGVLTGLMRAQLDQLHNDAAEPIATLWCSEAGIYGRFGYGLATTRFFTTVPRGATFMSTVDCGSDRVRELPREAALVAFKEVYNRVAPRRIGWLSRTDASWEQWYLDDEQQRGRYSPMRFAVHPNAYAAYRVRSNWTISGPRHELVAHEIVSADPVSHAAIWRYLLDIDLIGEMKYDNLAMDDPLPHMLVDYRAADRRIGDALWIRLVDVDRALTERRYSAPAALVVELTDAFCPWNAGRWRLTVDADGVAQVRRTESSPDLAMDVADLGALFLGGTSAVALAGAGRVKEVEPGSLVRLAMAFATEHQPSCAELF